MRWLEGDFDFFNCLFICFTISVLLYFFHSFFILNILVLIFVCRGLFVNFQHFSFFRSTASRLFHPFLFSFCVSFLFSSICFLSLSFLLNVFFFFLLHAVVAFLFNSLLLCFLVSFLAKFLSSSLRSFIVELSSSLRFVSVFLFP